MLTLVALVAMASFGMGAAEALPAAPVAEVAAPHDGDCPHGSGMPSEAQAEHDGCAMSFCCVSAIPDLAAPEPEFEIMAKNHVPCLAARWDQSRPERHKKPPKHT